MPLAAIIRRQRRIKCASGNVFLLAALSTLSLSPQAETPVDNAGGSKKIEEEIIVYGRKITPIGNSISASEGIIGSGEIQHRPVLRAGEILEFVPGMVVTQHSGSGKANQYFLRGFNLDHGTDFQTKIDGMPINMRSHGHGQGWTDLNFIIPEFVDSIGFQKGPYYADSGDFSTAGSAQFHSATKLAAPLVKLEIGEDGYLRSIAGAHLETEGGNLMLGLEAQRYDGPWRDIDEEVRKYNGLINYSTDLSLGKLTVQGMYYDNEWNSADQIPERAVKSGLIHRLGSIDTGVGGDSHRYSVSVKLEHADYSMSAYAIDSELELYSNFTYFLDDPVNGDQFEQVDDRNIFGGNLEWRFSPRLGAYTIKQKVGAEWRYDAIDEVGLYKTKNQQRLSTVRSDKVDEYSLSAYWSGEIALTERLSAQLGLRYDYFAADVDSHIDINSGDENDDLLSFKGGLGYTINKQWEAYMNLGQSFHSNDARGATIKIDPSSGEAARPVDLLVRGVGGELGLRFFEQDYANLSIALWRLDLDSELIFVGDAGNTEPTGKSTRWGVEMAAYIWPTETLTLDLELAWTRSRFRQNSEDEGKYIEGSLPLVASAGVSWQPLNNLSWDIRLRHFGKRTLDSFDNEKSKAFTVVNTQLAYTYRNWSATLSLLNAFDSKDHDIDYFYASRLPDEPAEGVEDEHFHPIEPRTLRLGVTYSFQ